MRVALWMLALAVGLYLLHRLALWAEARGYIFYLRTRPSPGSIGNALLEAHSLLEPDRRALIEALREQPSEETDSGAPPDPVCGSEPRGSGSRRQGARH